MTQPQRDVRYGGGPAGKEPIFNMAGVVVAIVAVCLGTQLLRDYVLTARQDIELLVRAAFIPLRYSGLVPLDFYSFSSPFTYTLLHGSFMHLLVNMVWLVAFGSPLANRIGVVRFLLFFAATGVAAAALHWVVYPDDNVPLVGASGAIAGMMGAAARFGFQVDRSRQRPAFGGPVLPIAVVLQSRTVVMFLAIWMVVNVATGYYGLVPGMEGTIAWQAHIGGLLAGFFGIRLFDGESMGRPRFYN
ncbi:rhomboid family intramembrane serine protease [Oryzicola mucosus]|uniref:Rhomboid family intramembrane serine protease n=1 Tax=Oryzicola mucosus TaxID=2767425 RepID=A0A8J6PNX5_9HYPH|nr:rhomboid family intramembrane serine protease [Oryzicola mucosus]MBD0414990.1 rhomboid family intramembrane serine protease [Oryzicola mucosus]